MLSRERLFVVPLRSAFVGLACIIFAASCASTNGHDSSIVPAAHKILRHSQDCTQPEFSGRGLHHVMEDDCDICATDPNECNDDPGDEPQEIGDEPQTEPTTIATVAASTCSYPCTPVVDPGMGSPTKGGGGGLPISMTGPQAGLSCDGSPLVLGTSDLSASNPSGIMGNAGTGANGSTVVDIWGILPAGLAGSKPDGWVYLTSGGNLFIQYNPNTGGAALANFIGTALSSIPAMGGVVEATFQTIAQDASNPTQITSQDWLALLAGTKKANSNLPAGSKNNGPVVHSCFSSALKATG